MRAEPRDPDETRRRAREALARLRGLPSPDDRERARPLVKSLRDQRDFDLMGELAEAISRLDPGDATNRRLYAQQLIDTGKVTVAVDVLQALARRLAKEDPASPECAECAGLLGRCFKQIFCDAGDKTGPAAREALKKAIAAYRGPYDQGRSAYHGVNLLALLQRARSVGLKVAGAPDPAKLAADLVAQLQALPDAARDEFHLATLAEASVALRDWAAADDLLRRYVTDRGVDAFQLASTLRQFTEVWNLEADPRGRSLVDILRARLLRLDGAELRLAPAELQHLGSQPAPPTYQLEAILGTNRTQTWQWWRTGVERAASVAAIRQRTGSRLGTGFLLRAGDLGVEPGDELLVLTNHHVVNADGAHGALRPEEAEVVFEAAAANVAYPVAAIVWTSPPDRHDAALLRLAMPVQGVAPLPLAAALPVVDADARVYIIGHPGGRDLAFSFQDNELLDHEGPPAGQPADAGVCRLHYRAPTEGGSSGSPVFNSRLWQVVALHHAGGKIGMKRLNGKPGSYAANEGIALRSIAEAIRAAR